jgi:hypothetical protein
MKIKPIKIYCLMFAFVLAGGSAALAPQASAALDTWQKGASIQSQWNGDFDSTSFKQSVDNLAATHANYVSLVFRIYQSNLYSTDIQTGGDTPTDQALSDAIDYVHGKGMHVMIKPHLESYTGEWRAYINPSDRSTWFANYGNMMVHYGQIAAAHGAEDFCVGTELIDMSSASVNGTNTQNWINLINRIRGVYSGHLTYGANWGPSGFVDEKNNIQFWSSLDYIGISAYYNLNGDDSINNLESQWSNYNNSDIQPLSARWNKPIVFTEIGYKSVTGSHTQPWNYNFSGGYDSQEQANDYQALFDFWQHQPFMQGVQLWEWRSDPNAGWSGDTNYTPQHKPAQDTMTQWFDQGGSTTPPPGNTATFSSTASANPNTVSSGQATTITANVTASNGAGAGIIVDVEIYSSGGQRVGQQVFQNQMFNNGQTQSYKVSFTPSANDTFKVKIGVFNYNWSQLYNWNDNAATFGSSGGSSGGGGSPPPPPPTTVIDIWWPTDGSNVGGSIVPFKALVENRDVSTYNIYWQVDGGGLVFMPTNTTDYPHKEFDADLTNWTWRGNGPYTVNFVAQDLSGNVLGQKSVSITVWH